MPITVPITTGVPSSKLTANASFVWQNTTDQAVEITNCSGFATESSYSVAAKTASGPGETSAQINASPTSWTFTETPDLCNPPGGGVPRIQNPTMPEARERDVA
ncbi:MAG TPA: hypothetical protein VMD76_02845 [Candidatus Sulfotelmatobacter sp.]|jgi:hypothetical protein|nr:hypothetical protein [Candidatus Sulfotelmatobacter sp.]